MPLKRIFASFLALLLVSCSGSDDSSVLSGSTISTLPSNTDPVVGESSSGFSTLAALTGLKLDQWGNASNWQSGNSRAMCEVGQILKESLAEAMNPDKIKCYVGAVAQFNNFGTIDDGNDVYFQLVNFPESPSLAPRIKMKITKNSSGRIDRFEMWSCFDHNGSNFVQSEYILQTIDSNLAITSYTKHTGSDGSTTYGGTSTVNGTLNSSYQWLSKSMSLAREYNSTGATHQQEVDITQRSSSFVVSGYNAGTWGQDRFTNALYAVVQGLDMSSPKNIALGDGTASFNLDWCFDSDSDTDCSDESGPNRYVSTGVDSWNGDTQVNLSSASDGDYFSEVSGAVVPSVSSVSTISFSGGEVWDCNAPSTFLDADLADMENTGTALGAAFAACDNKYDFADQGSDGYACDASQ